MVKNIKTSHETFLKNSFQLWRYATFLTLPLVFIASFMKGGDFELINVIKAVSFILLSWSVVCYSAVYLIVWKSIRLGELEDNGILFKKDRKKI